MKMIDYAFAATLMLGSVLSVYGGNMLHHACLFTAANNCNDSPDEICAATSPCGTNCSYCPVDVAVPERACFEREGMICYDTGGGFARCGDTTMQRTRGECGGRGPGDPPQACTCNNPTVQGTCAETMYVGCTWSEPIDP